MRFYFKRGEKKSSYVKKRCAKNTEQREKRADQNQFKKRIECKEYTTKEIGNRLKPIQDVAMRAIVVPRNSLLGNVKEDMKTAGR